jgi:hypothetical protein
MVKIKKMRERKSIPSSDPSIGNGGNDKVFDFIVYCTVFVILSILFGVIFSTF